MFLGSTDLVIGHYADGENVGTISTITPCENGYIFAMYDGKKYIVNGITKLEVLIGGGDKIFTKDYFVNQI